MAKSDPNSSPNSSTTSHPATQPISTDVIIIGGGLVGGSLAAALGQAGMKVCVVDQQDPEDGLDAAFDGRASAIALSSQRALAAIGLWDEAIIDPCPMNNIRVSDGPSHLFLHYDAEDIGGDAFGFMVENRNIRKAIHARLSGDEKILRMAPATVAEIERDAGGVTVELNNGQRVRSPLLIGADGRNSYVRDWAGIKVMNWDYNQTGIVCTVAHEKPHNNIAQEHFLPAGPFAILPLNENRASIVWTERAELAPAIMALDDAGFLAELEKRFSDYLGKLTVVGGRWAYPLSLQQAETATAPRMVLVGDADHGMHPIAGQGLNMGLRDVAAMAEVLSDARKLGLDLGDALVIERYTRWRRFDNTLMLAMTDGLNRLFSNDIPPVQLARDVGLAAVNKLRPLKKMFMRHAMGTVGDLPRLMRGEPL